MNLNNIIILSIIFYVVVSSPEAFKIKNKLGLTSLFESRNWIDIWLTKMFFCSKCASFQITFLLLTLSGNDIWGSFLFSSAVSVVTQMIDDLMFKIR